MGIFTKGISLSALLSVSAIYAMAQANLAGVSGKVLSPEGQPLPSASVVVKNESTGFVAKTVTNAKGEFLLKELPLGTPYSITVDADGMTSQKQTGFALNQGDLLQVSFDMTPATEEGKTVEISAGSLRNKIENIGASTAVTAKDIAKLPVNGRNFTSLTDLSPLSTGSSLGGQLASGTNYTIDGMAARGTISGGQPTGAYAITMEAVREFQVVKNQYDLTYGNAGGVTISTVTN